MSENKTGKYLKYAIGEIVLVVIGILIALSINNWNEEKNIKRSELQFLTRLKSDLIKDTIYFNRRTLDANKVVKFHHQFITELYEEQENIKEVKNLFKWMQMISELLNSQNSTYIEMISSGKLDIISKEELKNNLLIYYGEIERASKHIEEFNTFSVDLLVNMYRIVPYIDRVSWWTEDFQSLYAHKNIDFYRDWGFINDPNSLKFQTIEFTVIAYKNKHKIFLEYFNSLKILSSELINLINEEIEDNS
jgi:hypothetical protein